MKIIYLANSRIPTERAHGYQISKMCEQFASNGAEVELLAPFRHNGIRQDLFEFYRLERIYKFSLINLPDFLLYEKFMGRLAMYAQWLFFTVKLFFLRINPSALVYTRDRGAAWVFGLRGFTTCYEAHDWPAKQEKLVGFLLKRVNFIVTTNNFIKKQFVKKGFKKNKILVAANGIDTAVFAITATREQAINSLGLTDIAAGKKILLYTGSFKTAGREKGIADVLLALRLADDHKLIFMAAGGGQADIERYKKIAAELGVGKQTYFYGRQAQEKLAVWQKAADALLMPFPKIAPYEFFMTPLKMFEYLAAGRPIIASDLPSVREVLNEKNAIFFRPGDPADLAKKIKQPLEDSALAARLSSQAVLDAGQYDWHKRAKRILEFIS